jgi:predicted MFS family arabinose efflux permease
LSSRSGIARASSAAPRGVVTGGHRNRPSAGYGTVSAIRNSPYDIGMGVGAPDVGLLVSTTGYPAAFLLTAPAMVPAPVMARRR